MYNTTSGLNISGSGINLANMLSSRNSSVRQLGLIMMVNSSDCPPLCKENHNKYNQPLEIRLTIDGKLLINGKNVDSTTTLPGFRILVDSKEAKSE